ncbi:MAG: protein kinase [Myxococcales bacterium]|nr:protein kinase [Myxococcales bacterium]
MSTPESAMVSAERPKVLDAFNDAEERRLFASVHTRLFGDDGAMRAGRYVLLRALGAGAMGEVHLAHDEALDRKVAVKLVHSHLVDVRWADHLRREARMLARSSHPNVVHVYEVGELDGRVYLAMEYVQGESLGRWLRRTQPSWALVLAAYVEAGRGLAAAHGAGVIHRDFKPDNVLRADDGRIVVADFGLAYVGYGDDTLVEQSSSEGGTTEPLLSRAGEIKGTPAYMAPEQLEGGTVDARADQFAWCVALYEGLWGVRPFPEHPPTLGKILRARSSPRVPDGRRVPAWIWPIVQRGLAYDADDRWPDMHALLAELARVPAGRRRRRRWIGTGVSLALAGFVGSAGPTWWGSPQSDGCAWIDHELDGVWDDLARERVQTAFARTSTSWADDSAERVTQALDRWSEAWLSARRALCRAPGGVELEDSMLRAQGACLDGRRVELGALVETLHGADELALRKATQAVDGLEDPRVCSTKQWAVGEAPPPPSDRRDEVDGLTKALAAVDARIRLGRPDAALHTLAELEPRITAVGYGPLEARMTYHRGRAEVGVGKLQEGLATLERAADIADAARDDRLRASCWRTLATFGVTVARDATRGQAWLRQAEVTRARLDDAPGGGDLRALRGHLLLLRDDAVAAERELRAAVGDLETRGELERLMDARTGLGLALVAQGRMHEALEVYLAAERESEQGLGPRHPDHAQYTYAVGSTLLALGRDQEAEPHLRRAVEIWTESRRDDHPDLGHANLLLARFATGAGDHDAAERHLDAAERAYRALPADHPEHGDVASGRAALAYARGDLEAALVAAGEAIECYARALGDDDVYLAKVRGDRGGILLSLGRVDEAEQAFVRADAVLGRAADTATLREPTVIGLAVVALARGDNEDALRWLAKIETAGRPDEELAQMRLWTAIALSRSGRRAEARGLLARASTARSREERSGWLRLVQVDDEELTDLP